MSPEDRALAVAALNELNRRIQHSRIMLCMFTPGTLLDPSMAFQVGAGLLADKPFLMVLVNGARIPQRLRALAAEVLEIENLGAREASDRIAEAMRRVLDQLPKGGARPQ